MYTDGGTRKNGVSAVGWVLYAVFSDGQNLKYCTLALIGKLLQRNASAFFLESLALDGASEMLYNVIVRQSYHT